jgi:hypothetical protein
MTIDCTFCANEAAGVDRYEPCLVVLLEGPTDRAVTIMDGPFPASTRGTRSGPVLALERAPHPVLQGDQDVVGGRGGVAGRDPVEIATRADAMIAQMAEFYPAISAYTPVDYRLSVRAMPLSGADMRLVDVVRLGDRLLRVRAGKIDAVLHAEKMIRGMMQ